MKTDRKRLHQTVPTGDPRHITKIREGKQSSEVYCRDPKRRDELGLAPLPNPDEIYLEDLRA